MPASLEALTLVPVPLDPVTGKPFGYAPNRDDRDDPPRGPATRATQGCLPDRTSRMIAQPFRRGSSYARTTCTRAGKIRAACSICRITANATTKGVVGSLKIVGMFRSKTKWPKNMIAYARNE